MIYRKEKHKDQVVVIYREKNQRDQVFLVIYQTEKQVEIAVIYRRKEQVAPVIGCFKHTWNRSSWEKCTTCRDLVSFRPDVCFLINKKRAKNWQKKHIQACMMVGKKQVHNLSAKTVYSDTCNYAITVWVSVFFLPVICLVYCSTQSSFISTDRKLLKPAPRKRWWEWGRVPWCTRGIGSRASWVYLETSGKGNWCI